MRIATIGVILVTLTFLTGCTGRDAPTTRTSTTETGVSVSIAAATATEDSEIVDISSAEASIGHTKRTLIVDAEHASIWSRGTTSPDGVTTFQNYFILQKSERLVQNTVAKVHLTLSNASERAFDLTGIVLRAESSNSQVGVSLPGDVTNGKRLAPGESLVAVLTLSDADKLATGDTVTVRMFEVPSTISAAGDIDTRTSAELVLTATRTTEQVTLETYYTKEMRTYTGSAPADIAPFLRQQGPSY